MIIFSLLKGDNIKLKNELLNVLIVSNSIQASINTGIAIESYLVSKTQNLKTESLLLLIDSLVTIILIGSFFYFKTYNMKSRNAKIFLQISQIVFFFSVLMNIYLINVIYGENHQIESQAIYIGVKILMQFMNISQFKYLLLYLVAIITYFSTTNYMWYQTFTYYSLILVTVYVISAKVIIDQLMSKFLRQMDVQQNDKFSQKTSNENHSHRIIEDILNIPFCILKDQEVIFVSKQLDFEILKKKEKTMEIFLDSLKSPLNSNIMDIILQSFREKDTNPIQSSQSLRYENCYNQEVPVPTNKNSTSNQSQFARYKCIPDFVVEIKSDEEIIFNTLNDQKYLLNPNNAESFKIDKSKEDKYDITLINFFWEDEKRVLMKIEMKQFNQDIINLQQELITMRDQEAYKDNLLASVSHDFKTPLNGMLAIVQYLLGFENIDEKVSYYLKLISKNAHLLTFMIADLLDYTRIQKNELRLCWSKFRIEEVVQEVIELVSLQAIDKNIQINCVCNFQSLTMYSDPNRIKQILLNLLSNSLKFTNHGSITIELSSDHQLGMAPPPPYSLTQSQKPQMNYLSPLPNLTKSSKHSTKYDESLLRISVKDTGVGMPQHVQQRLFNQYATFDHNNGTNKHGVGLGLVICKKLVGMLGPLEIIQVESSPGFGSQFSFSIYTYMTEQLESCKTIQQCKYINVLRESSDSKNPKVQTLNSSSQILVFQTLRSPLTAKLPKPMDLTKLNSMKLIGQEISSKKIFDFNQNDIEEEDHNDSKIRNVDKLMGRTSIFDEFVGNYHQVSIMRSQSSSMRSIEQLRTPDEIMRRINPPDSRILVVDDQPFNVLAIKLLLKKFDWVQIECAYDGKIALDMVVVYYLYLNQKSGTKYNFIFLDIQMPIMDGYQTVAEIRKHEGQFVHVNRIIAVTGFDDEKEKQHCLEAGFDAFISKPLKLDAIIEVMKQLHYI